MKKKIHGVLRKCHLKDSTPRHSPSQTLNFKVEKNFFERGSRKTSHGKAEQYKAGLGLSRATHSAGKQNNVHKIPGGVVGGGVYR